MNKLYVEFRVVNSDSRKSLKGEGSRRVNIGRKLFLCVLNWARIFQIKHRKTFDKTS